MPSFLVRLITRLAVGRIMPEAICFVFHLRRLRRQKHQLWRALSTGYWQLRRGTLPLHMECEQRPASLPPRDGHCHRFYGN